jgi:hypothetical protein
MIAWQVRDGRLQLAREQRKRQEVPPFCLVVTRLAAQPLNLMW